MSQLSGNFAVTNGSADVYSVWDITLSSPSGTFTAAETLSFSGSSATGVVVAYLPGPAVILRCYVTSAALPVVGNTATGGSSSATGTVAAIANSTTWSSTVDAGDVFTVTSSGVAYTVGSVTTDAKLALSANYAGSTSTYAAGVISTSFTTNHSLAYPEIGDKDPETITKQAFTSLDGKLASKTEENVWTKSQHPTAVASTHTTAALVVDLSESTFFHVTLANNVSFIQFNNKPSNGTLATVVLTQDTTGGYSVGSWAGIDFGTAGAPSGYTSANDSLVLSLVILPTGTVLAAAGVFS